MVGFPFIKSVFLILPLLCLVCNADIPLLKRGLVKTMDNLQIMLESAVQGQKEEQDRIEAMSKLLDEAKYLTNMEQLKIFLQDLQEAADEAREYKTLVKSSLEILSKVHEENMKVLHPELQQMKMSQDPSVYQTFLAFESLKKTVMTYLDLKDKVFSGGAKDTAKNLHYVLNVLRSQELDDGLIGKRLGQTQTQSCVLQSIQTQAALAGGGDKKSIKIILESKYSYSTPSYDNLSIYGVMRAAVMFRNRKVVHVRRLVFIFTLLGLLCPANSWIDMDQLREMKENVELLKREAMRRSVDNVVEMIFSPLVLEKSRRLLDCSNKMLGNGRRKFPEIAQSIQSVKDLVLASKRFVHKALQNQAEKIKDYKNKISQLERIMMNLKERKSEL
ncbi:uncharacterized protein LOC129357243 [Poeciliopsis prolifica]|uniref:uncharacterized protein LOC129357243 n=1 Tax=Poeciliopsis prolifica TaxID=188132 RepID=UPI00241460A0|nr:uncharacterized protein LOC129357243 [Poeciliopsis prolifica]